MQSTLLSLNLQFGIKYKQTTQNWSRRREDKINDETERKREVEMRGRTIQWVRSAICGWMRKLQDCFLGTIRSAWWSWKTDNNHSRCESLFSALYVYKDKNQGCQKWVFFLYSPMGEKTSAIWSCGMTHEYHVIWKDSRTFAKILANS